MVINNLFYNNLFCVISAIILIFIFKVCYFTLIFISAKSTQNKFSFDLIHGTNNIILHINSNDIHIVTI